MDIEKLKELIGDDAFTELSKFIDELKAKHQEAVKESVNGRKGMKSRIEELEKQQNQLLERLGLESLDEIENLPDAKGQAEALKQFESKFKRMEKLLSERDGELSNFQKKYRDSQLSNSLSKALQTQEFIDNEAVEALVMRSIEWENDTPYYKDPTGVLLQLEDGVKHLATTKPMLVKAKGAGGSGFGKNGGSVNTQQPNPFAKDSFNLTKQIMMQKENPTLAAQLKAEATGQPIT